MQHCKFLGNVPARSYGAAIVPSDQYSSGSSGDHIDKTQQATYLQYRGGSWGNCINKTLESLRARADGDQLIFKGSLLPFDTVSDDG